MYCDDWLTAEHVICTPPSPEHLVAAGILACALGATEETSGLQRPAPVQVAAPTGDARSLLESWARANPRPVLWIIALDAATFEEFRGPQAVDWVQQRGGRILIGPEEVEPDPIRRVVRVLRNGVGRPLHHPWETLEKSASRRVRLIQKALLPDSEGPSTDRARKDRWQAAAFAAALTVNQAREFTEDWNTGGTAWERTRRGLGIADDRWCSPLIRALRSIDQDPAESRWLTGIIGFSATTERLRAQARAACKALRRRSPVWLVEHDPHQAQALAALIEEVAGEGASDATPGNPPRIPRWAPGARNNGLLVVPVEHEPGAYQAAQTAGAYVVDVPPLDERSMDIPHIALDLLWRLHREKSRPGAPRVGVETPEQLDWMRACWWDGTEGLHRWLADNLQRDPSGTWLYGPGQLPQHPGLDASASLGVSMTLDSVVAQTVRWALGAHSQQKSALRRLGVGTSRLPTCLQDPTGLPRRLLRHEGVWRDRWTSTESP